MIGNDRIALNNRFIFVFNALEEEGTIVMNDRDGKGIGDFAEKILGNRQYGHVIRKFLDRSEKRVIDYKHIEPLCQHYGVSMEYMLYGKGNPFKDEPVKSVEPIYNGPTQHIGVSGNITFTSVRAFAGSAIGADHAEDNQKFSIPDVAGSNLVAFYVQGNSMEPKINYGDMVVCEALNHVNEIKDNAIYAIKNEGSLWIKYVQKVFNKNNQITHLKLISENHLEHDPFVEEVNAFTKVYKVIRLISAL